MIPYPLHIFSLFSIVLGIVYALWGTADVIRRPPHMTVMAFPLGFMAIAHFWLFGHVLQAQPEPNSAEFWFMMQLAMVAGFITAYPINWWLTRARIKERM